MAIPRSPAATVLLLYAIWNGLMQLEWLRFAPITTATALIYRVGEDRVGYLALVFPLLFLPLALPAGFLIDRAGVRRSLVLAATLMAAGAGLRCVAPSYGWLLAGQSLLAVAQPLVLALLSPLVRLWFSPQQSLRAVSRASLAMFLGIALAFVAIPWLAHLGLFESLRCDAGLMLALWLWTWFTVPADAASPLQPGMPVPPASLAPSSGIGTRLRDLLVRRDFLALLALIFLGNGYFNAISTWLEAILARRGIGAEAAGTIGMATLVGGLLGMGFIANLRQPGRWLRPIIMVAALTALPLTMLLFTAHSYPLQLATGLLLGLGVLSPLPLLIDKVTILGGAHSGAALGMFWLVGNLGAALLIWMLGWHLDQGGSILLCTLLGVQLVVAWWLLPAAPAVPTPAVPPSGSGAAE